MCRYDLHCTTTPFQEEGQNDNSDGGNGDVNDANANGDLKIQGLKGN